MTSSLKDVILHLESHYMDETVYDGHRVILYCFHDSLRKKYYAEVFIEPMSGTEYHECNLCKQFHRKPFIHQIVVADTALDLYDKLARISILSQVDTFRNPDSSEFYTCAYYCLVLPFYLSGNVIELHDVLKNTVKEVLEGR